MSTFRIENIDKGSPDEWIHRLNDEGIQIGDDIVAEDVNELAEGIQATQELLLKASIYAPGTLLDPNSGIAERLKIIEETAGQAGLQEVYEKGNIISVQPGRTLLFGAGAEFSLDDVGNLLLNPNTFRVKGSGAQYLNIKNNEVTSYLSDLLLGSSSPGYDTYISSGQSLIFSDSFLNDQVTLSEYGEAALATASQSLVGAINELKNSTFNTTLQTTYDQTAFGRIVTNATNGSFRIENGTGNPLLPALSLVGRLSVSQKAELESASIGNNTTINDTTGIATTSDISTTTEIRTPRIKNIAGDLFLQDNKITLLLSETGNTSLSTISQSIAGSINELKTAVDSIGAAASYFTAEHDGTSGQHEIITTQAAFGQNAIERLLIKDSSGITQFSVSGAGNVIANSLSLNGTNVAADLQTAINHASGDGSDHAEVAFHLTASNPHNVVGTLNGVTGNIAINQGAGIGITQSGSTITIENTDNADLQDSYDRGATGDLVLDTDALKNLNFRNSANEILLTVRDAQIEASRNILMKGATPVIRAELLLEIQGQTGLELKTVTGDVNITTADSNNTVLIQGTKFSDSIANALDANLPDTVVGAINEISRDSRVDLVNDFNFTIKAGEPVTIAGDDSGPFRAWIPVPDYHVANEQDMFTSGFARDLSRGIFVALKDVLPGAAGSFIKFGTAIGDIAPLGANLSGDWSPGTNIYLAKLGQCSLRIADIALLLDGDSITLDTAGAIKTYTASIVANDFTNGAFKISSEASTELKADDTLRNIMDALNYRDYMIAGTPFFTKAFMDGTRAKGKIIINGTVAIAAGDSLTITPDASMEGAAVALVGVASESGMLANQFLVGDTEEETAYHLAQAINRTTIKNDTLNVVNYSFIDDQVNYSDHFLDNSGEAIGHYCKARAFGKSVVIEWLRPGYTGNLISMITSTAGMTVSQMSGGESILSIHSQDRSKIGVLNASSNINAITLGSFSNSESGTSPYITEYQRKYYQYQLARNSRAVKVGEILESTVSAVRFFVNGE